MQMYVTSIMFGYFLRRLDSRFQLERSAGLLGEPDSKEEAISRLERLFNQADNLDMSDSPDTATPSEASPSEASPSASEASTSGSDTGHSACSCSSIDYMTDVVATLVRFHKMCPQCRQSCESMRRKLLYSVISYHARLQSLSAEVQA